MKQERGKKILILGLGSYPHGSGVEAALFFARAGAEVVVTDLKTKQELSQNVKRLQAFKNVTLHLGGHVARDIEWAEIVVRNPGVRQTSPELTLARKLNKRIESDVSLFLQMCPCPVVGITGTRGKSTTATLVADMLKQGTRRRVLLGGNILNSPLTFLSQVKKNDFVVLELSSWLLETTGADGISPAFAAVTNVMVDHLNSYDSMDAYAEAKAQIFRHQNGTGILVLNDDDTYGRTWKNEASGRVFLFGNNFGRGRSIWLTRDALEWIDPITMKRAILIPRSRINVAGDHNALNIATASLLARLAGASVAGIKKAIVSFKGLPNRQEEIATICGVRYINDTTATTPDATIAALRAFAKNDEWRMMNDNSSRTPHSTLQLRSGQAFTILHSSFFIPHSSFTIHLILGGADKELSFDALATELRGRSVCISLLPGTAHEKIVASLKRRKVLFHDVSTLKEAVTFHAGHATKGDVILLSPGCASFGLFKNEYDRGEQFKRWVAAMK